MELNPANSGGEKSSILSFDTSTAALWVAIGLLLVETFSGALRFYFDKAGVGPLLYLPKVGCVLLFVLELRAYKAGRLFWVFMGVWVLSGLLAMLHGASLSNLAFSLFALSPLLFGLVCSQHLLHRKKALCWAMGFCLAASLVGLALDKYTYVPWKGYSYQVGDTELSANTSWSADEQDRIAGFARVSNVLSILIALYTIYLLTFIKPLLFRLVLSAVAMYAIVLTTSKAPAAAFALTMGLLFIQRMTWTCRILCMLVVGFGLLLPTLGLMYDFDMRTVSSGGSSLASLYDRLNNTWPRLVEAMNAEGWGVTGAGFGMVGSTMAIFPVPGGELLLGADSSAMYLWAMLGVLGIVLYLLQVPMLFSLINDPSRLGRMLLATGFCWCLISWTTDMFEVAVANLFIGMAAGYVLAASRVEDAPRARPRPVKLNPLSAPAHY
jgi:hypothetical protein